MIQKPVMNGSSDVSIGTRDGALSVIPENMAENGLTYRYVNEVPLSAPIEKGQRVSTLQIWCGNICVAQKDLYALNSVKLSDVITEINEYNKSDTGVFKIVLLVVGILVGFVLLVLIVLYFLRVSHIAKIKRHRRRNSAYRRRSR